MAGGATALVCLLLAVAFGLVAGIVVAALSGIYQTALYRYAAEGSTSRAFAEADLDHAFPQRR